jgi:transposase
MSLPPIISERSPWQIQDLTVDGSTVICHAVSTARGAACPCCRQWSTQVQSRYTRWARDVPWRQAPVRLAIQVRRFVCRTPTCPRRIFAERLPQLPPYARCTAAFTTWVTRMGWAHSAETAAALATTAGYPVSPDTVLRLLRRTPDPTRSTPRVLGVDDWALRKGRQYGTVLVDLETHRVVEVLPDRRAETIAAWLATHPGVAIVTRDRSETYAQGIARGAPAAQQVADRWHLLHNLAEAVDSWLAGWRPPPDDPVKDPVEAVGDGSDPPAAAAGSDAEVSAAVQRRRALRAAIHAQHTHGATVSAIARELGVHRATVRAY